MNCRKCGRRMFWPEQLGPRVPAARCYGCEMVVGRCTCPQVVSTMTLHVALSDDPRGCEHPKHMDAQCVRIARALQKSV
jgi:hypothetical protein